LYGIIYHLFLNKLVVNLVIVEQYFKSLFLIIILAIYHDLILDNSLIVKIMHKSLYI